MRSVSVFLGAFGVVASLTTVSAIAQDGKTDVISMGKNATALVTTRFGSATAFCIDPAGCFVTNHHAVKVTGLGNRVKLTMHSGEEQEQTVEAEVIAWSEADDLAILETKGPTEFASLALGETESLYETQRLSAFGYPYGDKLAVKENTKPTISVNGGSVSALRKNDGVLEVIQVDIALNPGKFRRACARQRRTCRRNRQERNPGGERQLSHSGGEAESAARGSASLFRTAENYH